MGNDLYAPFGKTFNFASPHSHRSSHHKEINNMLDATPRQRCMPAGTSNLGHDAFKILKDTNLMRVQQNDGEKHTTKQFRILRDEMNGRKKAFEESVADYKLSLVKARERKKQNQADNGEYWRSQME